MTSRFYDIFPLPIIEVVRFVAAQELSERAFDQGTATSFVPSVPI